MSQPTSDTTELNAKIRQQYDFLPYPESQIELLPSNPETLFIHSLATPYYLRYQKVVNTKDKIILDAGCGSGMKALVLALANPGAKIIGVDLSEKSIELARQRFAYHKFNNAEFYAFSLDEIESLGYQFDYINCDEVLYLLPNPGEMLKKFQSVLTPEGIIRANLHSYYQRIEYYRTQELLKFLDIFNEESVETALEAVKETIKSLKDNIRMKFIYRDFENVKLKPSDSQSKEKQLDEWIMMNYLLRGDKGYTIPELFDFLDLANLDFLSMVNWRHWDMTELFQNLDSLPLFLQLGLESASEREKLQLFELFNPIHRLLDFWCVQKDEQPLSLSPINWHQEQWLNCLVHLHPVLQTTQLKEDVLTAIAQHQEFEFSKYINLPTLSPITVNTTLIACLLPLWDSPQPFMQLVDRWLTIQPLSLDTLEPKTEEQGFLEVSKLLTKLETFTYILLEQFP
jgi:2-polyprenyl-3-methyl-5-hydroxy-6-metoxy-1,4-benzoquinol methylase